MGSGSRLHPNTCKSLVSEPSKLLGPCSSPLHALSVGNRIIVLQGILYHSETLILSVQPPHSVAPATKIVLHFPSSQPFSTKILGSLKGQLLLLIFYVPSLYFFA